VKGGRKLWRDDPKPAYKQFQKIYDRGSSPVGGKSEEELRRSLLLPVFETFGFSPKEGKGATDSVSEPDYRLHANGRNGETLAVCLAYSWGRSLDRKDDHRDKDTPEETPERS